MKKYILLIFLLLNFSNAEITHNVILYSSKNKCIFPNFYFKDEEVHYTYLTSPDVERSSTTTTAPSHFFYGYAFDDEDNKCYPEDWALLGLTVADLHFLEALVGVLFGFTFMVFTIYIFVKVGSRR